MRFAQLRKGERYILRQVSKPAVFEGVHGGRMELADGSVYYGDDNMYRFSYTDDDGTKRIVMLPNGTDVKEAEETKLAREKAEAEKLARQNATYAEAVAFMEDLGFEISDRSLYGRGDDFQRAVTLRYKTAETLDETEVEGITIGKIKRMLEASKATA